MLEHCALYPIALIAAHPLHAVSVSWLGVAGIAVTTLAIILFVMAKSMIDRRFALQAQQLADSGLRTQMIFDNLTEGIVVLNQARSIVQVNATAAEFLGQVGQTLSSDDATNIFQFFWPDGALVPHHRWPTSRALRGDFVQNEELIVRRMDSGKRIIAEMSTAPLKNRLGEAREIMLSYRDVTERNQINESRNRLAAIVESSGDAIFGKDNHDTITSWNKGAEEMFGYAAEEMIGQSLIRLLPPDRDREEDEILERIAKGLVVKHIQTVRKKKDGTLFNVSLTISPIRDSKGQITGASQIARDITERILLERQLMQSQKMEAVGQLTGGIAHDFNNLLGIIIGNLDILEPVVAGDAVRMEQLQDAQKAALRGSDLTRRLLAFAKMEGLKPSAAPLIGSIESMITLAARALGPEIRIITVYDPSVLVVFVDAAGLESALLNLVVNARDAMPQGGTITISTRLTTMEEAYPKVQTGELRAGPYACVSVTDTGHGMTPEVMERAFEPFFTTKPRDKGTGLGLAMVYGFVKQSGGTVRVYSELGIGTTLALYFPLLTEHLRQPIRPAVGLPAPTMVDGTVLVVDDEVDLLKVAVAYLRDMGCKVFQAKDGASALEVIKREQGIDLVVTDIIMPGGMNGVDLAQQIRTARPGIKILYCSGFPEAALAERAAPLVDGPLLQKPYQRAELYETVRLALGESRAEQGN